MINREEIIYNMCMTFRHDFGLTISEDDRMYSLRSGMTLRERDALFHDMSKVFDHTIAPMIEEYRKVNEGEAITIPKSEQHAKAMMGIAQFYLDSNRCES